MNKIYILASVVDKIDTYISKGMGVAAILFVIYLNFYDTKFIQNKRYRIIASVFLIGVGLFLFFMG